MSATWLPIKYREFYDVPRILVVKWADRTYLLESRFDAELDDYSDRYSVYELPAEVAITLSGSPDWTGLSNKGTFLGTVPIASVEFDGTKRKLMSSAVLAGFKPG